MKSAAWKLCFGSVLLVGLFSRVAAAQFEDTEDEKPDPEAKKFTRVMLRNTDATPGQSIVVPIYFTPAEGVAVGHLKITVTFVSVNMKFLKMERGIAAEISDIELKTSVKEGKNDRGVETSTLTIVTANSSSEPPKEGIHDGLFAYMTLKLSDTARPAVIKLNTVAEAKELGTNNPVKNLQTAEAQVEVFAPGTQPAVSCFFFSH
jgi:hypothetical protein